MARKRISRGRKAFSKNILNKTSTRKLRKGLGIDTYDPAKALLNEDKIGRAIWECLKDGDSEGVIEIIKCHIEAVNKTKLAEKAEISKTTMYHALRSKNPTIKTLAKLIQACS